MCVFVLDSHVPLSSCPFLDILHCLPRAVVVPLETALNLVSRFVCYVCFCSRSIHELSAHELRVAVCVAVCVAACCSVCCSVYRSVSPSVAKVCVAACVAACCSVCCSVYRSVSPSVAKVSMDWACMSLKWKRQCVGEREYIFFSVFFSDVFSWGRHLRVAFPICILSLSLSLSLPLFLS